MNIVLLCTRSFLAMLFEIQTLGNGWKLEYENKMKWKVRLNSELRRVTCRAGHVTAGSPMIDNHGDSLSLSQLLSSKSIWIDGHWSVRFWCLPGLFDNDR